MCRFISFSLIQIIFPCSVHGLKRRPSLAVRTNRICKSSDETNTARECAGRVREARGPFYTRARVSFRSFACFKFYKIYSNTFCFYFLLSYKIPWLKTPRVAQINKTNKFKKVRKEPESDLQRRKNILLQSLHVSSFSSTRVEIPVSLWDVHRLVC